MVRAIVGCAVILALSSCSAKDAAVSASHRATSAVNKAASMETAVAHAPGIQIEGDTITFAQGKVKIGDSMDAWRKAIPGVPRCTADPDPPAICTWDTLGIQLGTDKSLKNAEFFIVYLNLPVDDMQSSAGADVGDTASRMPKAAFRGQFKIDGFSISSQTPFSDVRSGIAQKRNVRCGTLDCSSPHGRFGSDAKIYMRLVGRRAEDPIMRISIERLDYGNADLTK